MAPGSMTRDAVERRSAQWLQSMADLPESLVPQDHKHETALASGAIVGSGGTFSTFAFKSPSG